MEAKQLLYVCDVASYTVNVDMQSVTHAVLARAFALEWKPSLITQWLCPDLVSWPTPLFLLFSGSEDMRGEGWEYRAAGEGGLCPA